MFQTGMDELDEAQAILLRPRRERLEKESKKKYPDSIHHSTFLAARHTGGERMDNSAFSQFAFPTHFAS
jgi:hypothetical protein